MISALFQRYGNHLLLCLSLLLFLALWLVCPQRLITSDPWGYSQIAYLISQGDLLSAGSENIFVHRLGATLPTGLFYALFGVSIVTTNLAPLISAILILACIWIVLPTRGAKLVGVALCATNITFFKMSVNLYPDIVSTAFMCLSTLILALRLHSSAWRWYWLSPAVGVLCLFFAFLAKLSAYWVLPLWLITLVSDLRFRRPEVLRRFYIPAIISAALVGGAYLLYNQLAWGHPLIRFINVSEAVEAGLWALNGADRSQLLFERLTIDALKLMIENYGVVFIPALVAAFLLPANLRIWGYYTLCTLLLFWFGTTSLASYQPMPLVERMPLPSLPGLCIMTAYLVTHVKLPGLGKAKGLNHAIALGIIVISVFQFNGHVREWQAIRWFEKEAVQALKQDMGANDEVPTLIVTLDTRSPLYLEFFFEYAYPPNLTVVPAVEFRNWSAERGNKYARIYLYQDRQMAEFLNAAYGEPLLDLSTPPELTRRLYEDAGVSVDAVKSSAR